MRDCMTCSVTSPVVTRGDEKSSPWNPLPRVCKVISPLEKALTHIHTHTHTPRLHLRETPAAQSSLPSSTPEGYEKVGAESSVSSSIRIPGASLEFTPLGLRTHTLPLSIVKEENEEEGSRKQKKERANTQRGEMQLISHVLEGLLVIVPVRRAECQRDGA